MKKLCLVSLALLVLAACSDGGSDDPVDIVYAAGSVHINGVYVTCYWKDGVLHTLTTEPSNGRAMAVADSSVYVASTVNNGGMTKIVCWKDGVLHTVIDEHSYALSAMSVVGSDIYIAGTWGGQEAFCFKN